MKRRLLLLTSVVLVGIPFVVAQSINGSPLSFQITTHHVGAATVPGLNPPLTVKWSVDLGGTVSYPIITGGRVFVIGGNPSTLYALDSSTGRKIWSRQAPLGSNWIGAAYEENNLFLVSEGSLRGLMVAFSATDGHQIWSVQLPYQYLFSSAPTARNGMVYTSGAGEGGTVYGVRASDGALMWAQSVENGDSSAPAVTPDGVFVSYVCPQTYKFAPVTGQLIWHYSGECEGGGGESVAVYRGLVYVRDLYYFGYQTDAITLNAATGDYVGGVSSKFSPAFWRNTGFYTEPTSLSAVDLTSDQT